MGGEEIRTRLPANVQSAGPGILAVSELLPMEPNWQYYVARHLHYQSKVAPWGAVPITLTAGAAWVLGVFSADILAADAEPDIFDIHWATLSGASANGTYDIEIYAGASDLLIAHCSITRTGVFTGSLSVACQSRMLVGGSRLRAKVMSDQAGATVEIKLHYHSY